MNNLLEPEGPGLTELDLDSCPEAMDDTREKALDEGLEAFVDGTVDGAADVAVDEDPMPKKKSARGVYRNGISPEERFCRGTTVSYSISLSASILNDKMKPTISRSSCQWEPLGFLFLFKILCCVGIIEGFL